MAKNLHIPRRRLSTNDLLKTLVLRAANARPGRPTPEHHPPNFTMVRRKPSKPPAGRSFLEKIPISSSRGRSIIRKCNADSRLIFDEEPIGDSRGRSIIHKYALNAKKLYFPDVIPTSSSFGYSIVHKCNANPGPRAKGGDPRMEKKVDLEGDTGTYPPLPHNADGIVRRVSGASHFTALREHYVQDLKKQELGALGPTTTGNKIAEELAGATKRYQEYLRMSRRDVYFRRPLVRNYVRYHGSTSTMETVRRASTVAGKTPLKPVDMDVERYHKLADKYIDELVAKFEAMQEEREDVDCEYSVRLFHPGLLPTVSSKLMESIFSLSMLFPSLTRFERTIALLNLFPNISSLPLSFLPCNPITPLHHLQPPSHLPLLRLITTPLPPIPHPTTNPPPS